MRSDIEALLPVINLPETEARYGIPVDNSSLTVCACLHCQRELEIRIINLKARLRKHGVILCDSCVVKRSWNDEKRARYRVLWQDEQFRERQLEKRVKQRQNPEYVRKHAEGCLRAQTLAKRQRLSDVSKQKWTDPEFRAKHKNAMVERWKDPSFRSAQAAFRTPEFRKRASLTQINVMANPVRRKASSEMMRRTWADQNYRMNRKRAVWTPEMRAICSEKQRQLWREDSERRAKFEKMWASAEFRSKLSKIIRAKWNQPEFRSKASAAAKAKWQGQGYRQKMIESLHRMWQDPGYRETRTKQSKEMWQNREYQCRMGAHRAAQMTRQSSIEKVTAALLEAMQIPHQLQLPVGPYIFDFFLPGLDIFIECQGEYWHSLPGRQSRDAAKFTYLEEAIPHAKLLYLQERDFLNPEHAAAKIRNVVFGDKPLAEMKDFLFKQVKISEIKSDVAAPFFNAFHYGGFGRSHKSSYGAFLDEELIAVCKFTSVIRQEVATSMKMDPKSVLELDRFCIHPTFHKKNFASWFLSRATKLIMEKYPNVLALVSFADMTHGHIGTIYVASGWSPVGTVAPDYCYVNNDGFVLHKKTLYNHALKMGQTEREYAAANGYVKVFGKEKKKFILRRTIT